jgi:hypothetical protein
MTPRSRSSSAARKCQSGLDPTWRSGAALSRRASRAIDRLAMASQRLRLYGCFLVTGVARI